MIINKSILKLMPILLFTVRLMAMEEKALPKQDVPSEVKRIPDFAQLPDEIIVMIYSFLKSGVALDEAIKNFLNARVDKRLANISDDPIVIRNFVETLALNNIQYIRDQLIKKDALEEERIALGRDISDIAGAFVAAALGTKKAIAWMIDNKSAVLKELFRRVLSKDKFTYLDLRVLSSLLDIPSGEEWLKEFKEGISPAHSAENKDKLEQLLFAVITKQMGEINKKIISSLLKIGINPNARDCFGDRVLNKAARFGNEELIKLLVESGANPNIRGVMLMPPLTSAILSDQPNAKEVVALLLQLAADPTIRDSQNCLPVDYAIERKNAEIVKLLLDSKINRDLLAAGIDTTLVRAVKIGDEELVKLILNAGASPYVADPISGMTALILAVISDKPDKKKMVELLLKASADLMRKDAKDKSALVYAIENNDAEVLEMLLSYLPKYTSLDTSLLKLAIEKIDDMKFLKFLADCTGRKSREIAIFINQWIKQGQIPEQKGQELLRMLGLTFK